MPMYASLFFYVIFAISILGADAFDWVPIPENGRFRPLAASVEKLEFDTETLKLIPTRIPGGVWAPAHALGTKPSNFTPYSDETYQELVSAYHARNSEALLEILAAHYSEIEGTPYLKAAGKMLTYPSTLQLKAEAFYVKWPLIPLDIFLYAAGAILLSFYPRTGRGFIWLGFALHTILLALRCYILGRPPVSNMFETVIYVPWISVALSILLDRKTKSPLLLMCGAFSAVILLLLLKVTSLNGAMENVQAVLDSQFWLLIHVLMVVGSYGIFILAGILAHVELIKNQTKIPASPLLPLLYMGTITLITGTILGGIWAAQSWGRFWDWDPKESWAFISSCLYLLLIHAYRFGKISTRGLALGAIAGCMAISFTWYGVNYILGTGLHSYGFGSGGTYWYYGYLGAEIAFLLWAERKNKDIKRLQN